MSKGRLILIALVVVALVSFFALDLHQSLSLPALKQQQATLQGWVGAHELAAPIGFFLLYVVVTALSLPGAAVLTLAAGALFGLVQGTVLVSFASSLGATLAFAASRFLFRDTLRQRFQSQVKQIDENVARDGPFYLASLRLVPVFPFFLINLLMGLTGLRTWTFYWVSQVAMLPGTLIYINAGTQLAAIESMSDVVSPGLLLSLLLLAIFPLLAKVMLGVISRHRLYKGVRRPLRFDYNLLVIGGGSAGLVSAYIGAAVKARVGLIEADRMGGDCLNTGCVPSKTLIRSANLAMMMRQADQYGLTAVDPEIQFERVMDRIQEVIARIEPNDSVERYRSLGVDCIAGRARLVSPWEVEVTYADGRREQLSSRAIVLATGARPFLPPIPGLAQIQPLTSENIWSLRQKPEHLLVLGGGPIGCELSQAFSRLGCRVTLVERGERLLSKEDPEASEYVLTTFMAEQIEVLLGHEAVRFDAQGTRRLAFCRHAEGEVMIEFDQVLVALGRKARTEYLGLDRLGIDLTEAGTLPTDAYLNVRYPSLFACGDVAGPYQLTHVASHQAWYTAVNGLFSGLKRFKVDYRVIPWVTFTAPEVGRVGLNETDALAQGIAFEVTRYDLEGLDRAVTEGENRGFIKVLTAPGKDRILGVTVVGTRAGEILAEFVLAMKHGIGLNKILGTIHSYPTWNESAKYAAGAWKRDHAPQKVLGWLARFHAWRRG